MNTTTSYALGAAGGVFVTIALLPQLIKLYQTRSSRDLSSLTYLFYSIGVLLWFFYGLWRNDWLLSLFKAMGFVLSVTILIGIWVFSNKKK
jgi:MtN3 and saliva related transmembrane protein